MKVSLVGAGLQGWRRASIFDAREDSELVVVADVNEAAAVAFARRAGCEAVSHWEQVVARDDVDIVVVCTPPHLHAPISIAAMRAGKHVLCEKPLARTMAEAHEMVQAAQDYGVVLKCGFNLRHHPAIGQVRRWMDDGAIGEPLFIRCRYGIGGRENYDKDWRADPKVSGGGQLMDQGIHVLDLCRWFLGDFALLSSNMATLFWNVAPLEDNAFVLLRTTHDQVAWVHVSWTQWKPLFSFEVFGRDGYAVAEGLGGAYGTERASLGHRDFTAPFEEVSIEFRGEDVSWREEWREFLCAVREGRKPLGSGRDGLEALRLAEAACQSASTNQAVFLQPR